MKNPTETIDAVEVTDSNIIDAIKTIRCRNKKRPDKNTVVDYLCKSYLDCNVTTIRQELLTWKIKVKS